MNKSNANIKRLVLLALFTAIVVILQFLGQFIRFGTFSISLVLVPIVIGAAMCGPLAGAWLGGVFGLVVLLSGDAALFLTVNPLGTVITVMLKGICAGLISGLIYKTLEKKNATLAAIAASVVCPIVNTGVFLLGCLVFFLDAAAGWSVEMGFGGSVAKLLIAGFVGLNFVFEFLVNVVLSSVIARLIKIGTKN